MTTDKTIRVVLVGGSGYAGCEAIRWLSRHPNVTLAGVFGPEGETGPMEAFYPLLSKQVPQAQELYDVEQVAELSPDVVLLCVPHKVAMGYVPDLRTAGLKVIDWSADYRIKNASVYGAWYCPHTDPRGLAEAVYGLPEYFAEDIAGADLIANPGCYPTCAVLPLAPLLRAGLIAPTGILVNAISGVSGAGRKASLKNHYPERNENFEPYATAGHRHQPEMEQALTMITGQEAELLFQPHLCPMDRGMLATIYATPANNASREELTRVLNDAYADAPFVRVRRDVTPATKYVAGTNFCDVSVTLNKGRVVIFSALDNLIKGASGQAIQNMNLMFGLDQTTGLY